AVLGRADELAAGLGDHALRHLVIEGAAAHAVARIEYAHLVPSLCELARGGEAGETRAHDRHLHAALPALGRPGARREHESRAGGGAGAKELATGEGRSHAS